MGMRSEHIGRYILLKPLATGGMADIFLAKKQGPLGFDKRVVIKRVRKVLLEDKEAHALFLNEARIHSRLNHPNIVQLFDVDQDQNSFFIVLEYVSDIDLARLIRAFRAIPAIKRLAYALQITQEVLGALEYVHQLKDEKQQALGLVHRDISPANILITQHGSAKLCDFGIAKSALQQIFTQSGVAKGKLRYMTPEQLEGKPVDHRTDLFALGACLFEMLTNEPLLYGANSDAVIRMIRSGAYLRRMDLLKEYDRNVRALLSTALSPSPNRRFSSAREFWLETKIILIHLEHQLGPTRLEDFLAALKARRAESQSNKKPVSLQKKPVSARPKLWSKALSTCLLLPLTLVGLIPRFFRKKSAFNIKS